MDTGIARNDETGIRSLLAAVALLLCAGPLAAEIPGEGHDRDPGAETRAWLQLQSSGEQAAPSPRQPGDAASRSYRRYLKSFERPIPDSYFKDSKGFVGE